MANQDLLYSVLPRPPVAPGSGEFARDIARIQKEPVVKKTEVHKDPQERAPQDEYHPQQTEEAVRSENDDEAGGSEAVSTDKDGQPHVDLFA